MYGKERVEEQEKRTDGNLLDEKKDMSFKEWKSYIDEVAVPSR